MTRKIAICIGLDRYASYTNIPNLEGCVNDALLIGQMLKVAGFTVYQLHNELATKLKIIELLKTEASSLKAGDYFVLWNSSHGYQIPDRDGDEPDGLDEAICTYDTNYNSPLTDDELIKTINDAINSEVADSVNLFFASDSCHSGHLSDFFEDFNKDKSPLQTPGGTRGHAMPRPRLWFPPTADAYSLNLGEYVPEMEDSTNLDDTKADKSKKAEKNCIFGKLDPDKLKKLKCQFLFLSASASEQTSCEAVFPLHTPKGSPARNRIHGVMTYNFAMAVLEAWKEEKPITYQQVIDIVNQRIKEAEFKQTAQLEGLADLGDKPVFGHTFLPES
jgi:hypothetical protein